MIDIQKDKAESLQVGLTAQVSMAGQLLNAETQKLVVQTDKLRLQQVLLNLQSNALKFTKQGGKVEIITNFVPAAIHRNPSLISIEPASVEQRIAQLNDPGYKPKLVTEVRDTGVGISSEDQLSLFKMFGKLKDTSQMNTSGVGLGLFICKQIVDQFDGEILVKSELGKGTSFFFIFEIEGAEVKQIEREQVADFDLQLSEKSKNLSTRRLTFRSLNSLMY